MRRATRWLGVGAMVLGLVGLALAWWAFTGLGEPGAEAGWGPGRYQHPAVVRYHPQVVALYGLGLASGLAGLVAGGSRSRPWPAGPASCLPWPPSSATRRIR